MLVDVWPRSLCDHLWLPAEANRPCTLQITSWRIVRHGVSDRALFLERRTSVRRGLHAHLRSRSFSFEVSLTANDLIADPGKLRSMLRELGPLAFQAASLEKGWEGVSELVSSDKLLPIVLAAALLAVMRPRWRTFGVWSLCLAALFALGLMGRPGMTRVYIPLASSYGAVTFPVRQSIRSSARPRTSGTCTCTCSMTLRWHPIRSRRSGIGHDVPMPVRLGYRSVNTRNN